jgi:hypothetical protein
MERIVAQLGGGDAYGFLAQTKLRLAEGGVTMKGLQAAKWARVNG